MEKKSCQDGKKSFQDGKEKLQYRRAAVLGNMHIILGNKKSRNLCEIALSPCLQGISRMRRSAREEQNTDV